MASTAHEIVRAALFAVSLRLFSSVIDVIRGLLVSSPAIKLDVKILTNSYIWYTTSLGKT